MIKKITLASVATMALLFIPAQAENTKCQVGMMQEKALMKGKGTMKGKMCHKRQGSPLLMRLPSPMRMLMKMDNDPKLALTAEQKTKLQAQQKEMMPKMMKLKEEIKGLQKEIRQASLKNVPAAEQKANVEKLAILKAQATMMKLTCIEGVKSIVTKEQQAYLKEVRQAKMSKMKNKMMKRKGQMMQGQGGKGKMGMGGMKCPNCSDNK